MMMDDMGIHDILWIVATGLIGFFVRTIWQKLETFDKELKEIGAVYVRKDDYKDDIAEIKNMLGKIFDRLETKADK